MLRILVLLISLFSISHVVVSFVQPTIAMKHISNRHPLSVVSASTESDECAALLPAQVVQIRVGDVSTARKAWKKRRRSIAPLLVPVTITRLDRESMVRHNVITTLHKYGNSIKQQQSLFSGDDGSGHVFANLPRNGIALTVSKVCRLCERDFGLSMRESAEILGYEGVGDMLLAMFDAKNAYGMTVVTGLRDGLLLVSKLTRRQGRELASKACLAHVDTSVDEHYGAHTGTAKVRLYDSTDAVFGTEPLSAAVRVKQEDVKEDRVNSGDEISAFVSVYDRKGDNGSPLLTLGLDPPRRFNKRGQRGRQQDGHSQKDAPKESMIDKDLASLKVGEGPFTASVVAVSRRAGAAFVDCGVGRERSKRLGGGTARVVGMLRFDDLRKENVDDAEEGSMLIEDLDVSSFEAEWEEANAIDENIDIVGDEDDEDEDDLTGLSPEERLRQIGLMLDEEDMITESTGGASVDPASLNVGDEVEVYIRAISRQSGRFMVTTDPSIKDKKAKELKMKKKAQKRLSKLAEKMEGIADLVGTEVCGVVVASSKTGGWFYVQPMLDGEEIGEYSLPVGVANPNDEEAKGESKALSPGDEIRVRLEGIDENRGQLQMKIV